MYPVHMYLQGRYKVVSWLQIIVLKVEFFRNSQSIGEVANEGVGQQIQIVTLLLQTGQCQCLFPQGLVLIFLFLD